MLESGSSGSVRGVLSNEHPYREPLLTTRRCPTVIASLRANKRTHVSSWLPGRADDVSS